MRAFSKRCFASVVGTAADLPASEHIRPGTNFVDALQAFTQHKIRGDKLGYAWRVETKAHFETPLFHYEQPVVHLPVRSPTLSDRFIRIDFPRHTMTFLEVLHEGVTEDSLRQRWAQHLSTLGFAEAERMVLELEKFFVATAPASARPMLNNAKKAGKNEYLVLRANSELSRNVVVPGEWLSALKSIEWPNCLAAQQKF